MTSPLRFFLTALLGIASATVALGPAATRGWAQEAVQESPPASPQESVSSQATPTESAGGKKPAEATTDVVPLLSLDDVDTAISAVEADKLLDDQAKAKLLDTYAKLKEILSQADQYADQTASLQQNVESAPQQVTELNEALELLPPVEVAAQVDISGSSAELRKALETGRVSLKGLTDELQRVGDQLVKLEGRPVEIASRLPEATREVSDIEDQWDPEKNNSDQLSPTERAEKMLVRANYTRLRREVEMMKLEQLSQTVREEVLQAKKALLTRQVENAKTAVNTVNAKLDEELASDVDRIQTWVKQAVDDLPGDEDVQALAEEVQQLSSQFETVVENLKQVSPATREVKNRLDEITQEFRDIRTELNLGSGGNEVAQVLLELGRRAQPSTIKRSVPITVERARLDWFALKKKRRQQDDIEASFADRESQAVTELVTARKEILDQHLAESANLTQMLGELQTQRQQFLDLCEDVQKFVSESLFGFKIRICPPIRLSSFTEVPTGLAWIFRAEHLAEVQRAFLSSTIQWILASIVFLILLLLRQPLKRAVANTIPPTRRTSTDRYWWTAKALLWTLLLAAPFAIFVGSIAYVLGNTPDPSDWMLGLVYGAKKSALIAIVAGVMYEICRPKGLGIGHFDWNPEITSRATSILKSIIIVYVPVMLLVASTGFGEASQYMGSVGRVGFILSHAWVANVLYRKLYLGRKPENESADETVSRFVKLWRRVWGPLWIGTPIMLIIIACFGYMITAADLSYGLFASAGIVVGGVILVSLAVRAFEIRRRRMKLREAIAKRRAHYATLKEEDPDHEQDGLLQLDEEEELALDLVSASDQTVNFFRLLFKLGIIVALYKYWSSVIPLTAILDDIPILIVGGLSLLTLVKALLVAGATFAAVRNLPGLLEFTVLRGSTIEAGTRNAIYTLCQYAVVGLALISISNILQLDWEKFGWMAAALSVGLGFGLQEVVANFVCGLILLFERPIRVGDIVTLDGTTGTVTNINMRATTVTNWDRQELVVPNKTLITGNILNWTLSAAMNRVVIPVGVAYGTDTDRAREILLDVAAKHPDILDDPKPLASFEQFADSSLNLILRAYLPDLDNRLSAISDLHTEIIRRFTEEGIEIPFPQQDMHLRSGLEALAGQQPREQFQNGQGLGDFAKPL